MAVYRVRILDAAVHELAKLDQPVGRRIVKRISWLAENLEDVRVEALTGELVGLYKFRIGDYRVIYELLDEEQCILVHQIGHRREVYRKR